MGMKNVRLLALLMVGMGMIVGTIDIVSVACAREWGYPAAASLILAASDHPSRFQRNHIL